jgi:RHS repeat-associated protein
VHNCNRILIILLFTISQFFIQASNINAYDQPWDGGHTTTQQKQPKPDTPDDPALCKKYPQPDSAQQSPVYIKSGNLNISFIDIFIKGRGYGLKLERTYNNQERYDGPMGHGWMINLFTRLVHVTDGLDDYYIIQQPKGKRWRFRKEKDASFTSLTRGVTNKLVQNNDGTFTINPVLPSVFITDNFKYTFDSNGFLLSIVDTNTNAIHFTYDQENRLISVTDDSGRSLSFTYNNKNKVETITDPANSVFKYIYDENNNLIGVVNPLSHMTSYMYDSDHNLISIIEPKGNTVLQVKYNSSDQVISYFEKGTTNTYTYDLSKKKTVKNTPNGNYTYYYDDDGNLLSIHYPDGTHRTQTVTAELRPESKTDPNGNQSVYTYDERSNIVIKIEAAGTQSERKWHYTYHSDFDKATTITDPFGRTTQFEYDIHGNNTKIIDPLQGETSITYDNHGDILTITNPAQKTTTYTYDNYGYLQEVRDPLGNAIIYSHDSSGNLKSITNKNGHTTVYEYNLLNQVVQITDALNNQIHIEYDKNGNICRVTNPNNTSTEFVYNSYNQLEKIMDANGDTTTYQYDANGNLLSTIDAENNAITYTYDIRNRLIKKIDAQHNTTEYTYDDNSNLIAIKDAKNNTTKYSYDNLNRLVKETCPDGTTKKYIYDKIGNLISKIDQNDRKVSYEYDAGNRLCTITYPDNTQMINTYDLLNRLTTTSNEQMSITYTYDSLNRVIGVNQNGKNISYAYDNVGNRTKLIYPDNSYITYEYDKLNNLNCIKNASGEIIADYSYNNVYLRTQLDLNNGIQTSYQYDKKGNLLNLINKKKTNQEIISSFSYTYDRVGNRTTMTAPPDVHYYTYDKIYQITAVDYPDNYPFSDAWYIYDKNGNRRSTINESTLTYTSNHMNQYTSVNNILYEYDPKGNLTNAESNTYQYNDENKLVSVQTNTNTTAFDYDSFNRRIRKDNITYVYDGARVIAEYDNQTNNLIKKFIYGSRIDEPIMMIKGAAQYYYQFDGLGSVSELTDSNKDVVEKYNYDAYGKFEILDPSGAKMTQSAIDNPYYFTGRKYDFTTGLYYYRERDYSPDQGRFIQVDPLGYSDGLNVYQYVHNNPIRFTDPFGLAYRQERPLAISWWWALVSPAGTVFVRNTTMGSLHHDRFLYNDGTDSGYYSDSKVRPDDAPQSFIDSYENVGAYLHDDILRQAEQNIRNNWDQNTNPEAPDYSLWSHNCQDYADEVLKEYDRLTRVKGAN